MTLWMEHRQQPAPTHAHQRDQVISRNRAIIAHDQQHQVLSSILKHFFLETTKTTIFKRFEEDWLTNSSTEDLVREGWPITFFLYIFRLLDFDNERKNNENRM